ncbi:MAG: ester cyclase [Chloroflexi bacterium]|nr:ester cyclase [Chloroflexota bacterium]
MTKVPEKNNRLAESIWQGTQKSDGNYSAAGRSLSVNEMKDAMVRLYDESNKANFAVFHEMLAPEFISYGGAGFQDLVGADAFQGLYVQFLTSMPDLHFRVDQVVAEGDLVGVRGRLSGTHKGNFMGFAPPTGKFISWTGTAIFRFDGNGLMDARWQEWDGLSVMQQMGVIPVAAEPAPSWQPPEPVPPYVSSGYSSPNQNKIAYQRLVDEVWNKGNLEVADQIYHPDASYPSNPSLPTGSQGIKSVVSMFHQAMPDFHIEIKTLLTDGDMVLAWVTKSGTQTGSLMGVPATSKKVSWGQMLIARFSAGKIVESWNNEDILGLMQQLGVGGSASSGA